MLAGKFLFADENWTSWILPALLIAWLCGGLINRGLMRLFPSLRVKPVKPRFNDDFYCRSVEEFENEVVPGRVKVEQMTRFMRLVPFALVIGGAIAPSSWRMWVAIAAMVKVFAILFGFLDEINENIRFVRHQMRAFRDGVASVHEQVCRYNDPERNFNLYDALSWIDREWEHPRHHPTE